MASPVVEDYLQTIHFMMRVGVPVIAARLSERLHVTPPTVTATIQRMTRDGLVEHGAHHEIRLTAQGRATAEDLVRRHALAERLLTDFLQLPWHEAHEASHGFEHAITPQVEERLVLALGNPTTCPHGNPIPGVGQLVPEEIPLDHAPAGAEIVVQRITEEAEEDLDLMRYLQSHGFAPGAFFKVDQVEGFNQTIVLEGQDGTLVLGFSAAAKVRVVSRNR
jgi:DtxR family transcriptional regulator, Mn-dependent transcriptional regulator